MTGVVQEIRSLMQSGCLQEAAALCVRHCTRGQRDPALWCLSAVVHGRLGRFAEAERYARRAIALVPGNAEAHFNHAIALLGQYRLAEAEASLRRSLGLSPGNVGALRVLGHVYGLQQRWLEEIACYRKALEIAPASVDILYALGRVLNTVGHHDEALDCFERALGLAPEHAASAFGRCIARIPVIYKSKEHVRECREQYRACIQGLDARIRLDSPARIQAASQAVGDQPNFFLAYQGRNDCDLQSVLGGVIERIQHARYPHWSRLLPMPPPSADGRLRIGIVSRFFYNHSNWKMPIKGWVEQLDRSRFELFGYYTGLDQDACTVEARNAFAHFVERLLTVESLATRIRSDELHVLIYPEIGMDQLTLKLASLRLAPVQCSSWGHPETSGLSSIDYFLSAELMEPPGADDHYTEQLVRLPNTSLYYEPVDIGPDGSRREDFGLRPDGVLYFCAQSLFKYLPEYDWVFAAIAHRVPGSQFAFIASPHSDRVNRLFLERLDATFTERGLKLNDHVTLLPRLNSARYQAVCGCADVFLDSIGWSGCNSTMEAIAHDIPVLTLPGELMRSRHTLAFLHRMGLPELVAGDLEQYIELAVRLGCEETFRARLVGAIRTNKEKIYRDREAVTGLEAFLARVVDG